jgi:hypothetical protein
MQIGDASGYGPDMGILWAAYKAGSFGFEGRNQTEFAESMLEFFSAYDSIWMVDDESNAYPTKRGPVGMFVVRSDGNIIQPDFNHFKWASKKNIMRSIVSFLNWVRFSKDVTLCVFGSNNESKQLYWRMREFGIMLTYVGNGMFALAGEKQCQR